MEIVLSLFTVLQIVSNTHAYVNKVRSCINRVQPSKCISFATCRVPHGCRLNESLKLFLRRPQRRCSCHLSFSWELHCHRCLCNRPSVSLSLLSCFCSVFLSPFVSISSLFFLSSFSTICVSVSASISPSALLLSKREHKICPML